MTTRAQRIRIIPACRRSKRIMFLLRLVELVCVAWEARRLGE